MFANYYLSVCSNYNLTVFKNHPRFILFIIKWTFWIGSLTKIYNINQLKSLRMQKSEPHPFYKQPFLMVSKSDPNAFQTTSRKQSGLYKSISWAPLVCECDPYKQAERGHQIKPIKHGGAQAAERVNNFLLCAVCLAVCVCDFIAPITLFVGQRLMCLIKVLRVHIEREKRKNTHSHAHLSGLVSWVWVCVCNNHELARE